MVAYAVMNLPCLVQLKKWHAHFKGFFLLTGSLDCPDDVLCVEQGVLCVPVDDKGEAAPVVEARRAQVSENGWVTMSDG